MKVDVIDENDIKSPEEKVKWREYCELFKNKVEDHSFGTLLRLDCKEDYSEKNSTLVPKIQFFAIELARNREGCNNCLRDRFSSKNINVDEKS